MPPHEQSDAELAFLTVSTALLVGCAHLRPPSEQEFLATKAEERRKETEFANTLTGGLLQLLAPPLAIPLNLLNK